MTQATLAAFYIIYTTTYIDAVQAEVCQNALMKSYGVDTSENPIGNTTD